ncbi:hypothetical protein U6A24_06155 [Aquimarina gracilis]|uniref:Uncharacterized protein n=1 Tax=Aquimarina gracilis TaxID=874422 RepID=A0ABU5ZTR3_9FLAO|nr:hypothetical protein [Aquimarina gracilis]MEB3345033.1 hypothetical protein [Aquimarina gracilis]
MKKHSGRIDLKGKLIKALIIVCLGILLAYLFLNTQIVEMVLDLFSPYPENQM